MSWPVLLGLAAGCYGFKLAGQVATVPPPLERAARLLPVALLAALVAVQTFGADRALRVDARAAGLAVAALLLVRRAPLVAVVVAAAATTALVRALG